MLLADQEHALADGLLDCILLWRSVKIGLTLLWYTVLAHGAQSIQGWFFNARPAGA